MYSKYNTDYGKRKDFDPQVADREDCFVADIPMKNYFAFSPTAFLNIEENKISKIPESFKELKVFNTSTYDFENNDNLDDNYEFTPISPNWGHIHNDQNHSNYHHKANEFQYPKINRQHHKAHQCNDHSHKYRSYPKIEYDDAYYNINISSPLSLHHKSVNKNELSNNNYNNKYYKTAGDRFIGDYYDHQSLPTDCLQVKSLSPKSPTFVSNQHYQHYYSYFYNKNTRNIKFANSSGHGRKLPITSRMSYSKKNLYAYDVQLKSKRGLSAVDRNNCNENGNENNYRQSYNYVLTEKTTNNNDVTTSDNVYQDKFAAGDYLYIKNFNDYKTSQSPEEDSKEALLYLQKYKNKRKLPTNSVKGVGHCYYNNQSVELMESLGNNEISERQHELKTLNENEKKTLQKNIKLPPTPTKVNVFKLAKKYSPPPKNRRVLIYNIQSPRLSTSHVRLQKSKLKINSEIKGGTKNVAVDTPSQEYRDVTDNVLVIKTARYNKNLRKIICDNNKNKEGYKNEDNQNNSDDNSDDDDFDNDFDSSGDTSNSSSDSEEGYKSYAYKLTHSSDVISTSISIESSINSETDILSNPDALLVPSLFPNVPPYLAFSSNTKKGPEVPSDLYRILKWRVSSVMPRVVRSILANSGMRLLKSIFAFYFKIIFTHFAKYEKSARALQLLGKNFEDFKQHINTYVGSTENFLKFCYKNKILSF